MNTEAEFIPVTGPELEALAKKHVPEGVLNRALKNPAFREFMRILHFMSLTGALSKQDQSMGHQIVMQAKNKEQVLLEFDIKIKAKGKEA